MYPDQTPRPVQVSRTSIDMASSVPPKSRAVSILLVSLCWFSCLIASCTSSPSPIKPPPPYHQGHRQRRGGFSGVVKQSKRDSGIKMKAQIPTVSADDPFVVSPHLGTPSTASSALSIPDLPLPSHSTTPSPSMFTIPDLPLPSHSSQYPASKGPTVPGSSLDMPPSNQLAAFHTTTNSDSGYQSPPMYSGDTGAIETTPRSKRNLSYLTDSVTIMPACLWEPPDAHTAFMYNRHLEEAFQNLRSNKGISSETFWRAFDMCNCYQFFTKEALHYVHGPKCPMWAYPDIHS
ncbi:hypothetical protein JB92DRAFT_3068049 [Gautieria morchelliformis]|nr:hypothetical protein JB92DRAFT_3068049 [Gautieria morchelliformis]